MKEFIRLVSGGHYLSRQEASAAMRTIMEGGATDAQIAGLLIALKMKGEHPDELLGFTDIMREKSVSVTIDDPDAIDMCGTGGDGAGTFNISTVASLVVAGTGVTVAKHGNRSISGPCGSADVLQALGVKIDLTPEKVSSCINTIGIGFIFAPLFHPSMKHAAKARSELGVRTAFNLLGPLTNPAGVRRQLVGTFDPESSLKVATVFSSLSPVKVFVVHSKDGLDEISLGATTRVYEINENSMTTFELSPVSFGFPPTGGTSSIRGGTAETNASIAWNILRGDTTPHRNYVVANAAIGLMVAGRAASIMEGVSLAEESIDSGTAMKKLNQLVKFSNR